MGSRNRTLAQNVAIVKSLPRGAHAIVFIGVNLGAFTSTQKTASITLPSPLPTESPDLQQPHQYSTRTGILSPSKKKALVQSWLADRYPVFKRSFSTSAGVLETLIKTCKARGYKPVLLRAAAGHRHHRRLAQRADHQVPRQVLASRTRSTTSRG